MWAVYAVPVFRSSGYPLPFQNMGLLSEQLVRPNPRWPNITGIIPKNVGEVAGMVYLDNRIQAVPRTTQQELLQQGQSYCCRAWKTPRSELAIINKLQRNKCLMGLEPQRRKKPYLVTIVAILHKAGRLVVPGETQLPPTAKRRVRYTPTEKTRGNNYAESLC